MRIAVIGAGLAGLTVARGLSVDHQVTVFEKSRGLGGRIATRHAGDHEFDHGAQFFTAHSAAFKRFLKPLIEQYVVANWPARFVEFKRDNMTSARQWADEVPHYVGVPRMNAIGKWLARGIDVRLRTTVTRLMRKNGCWQLLDGEQTVLGQFDWVVLTAPAPQTAALLPATSRILDDCRATRMHACCALMLAYDRDPGLAFDAAHVENADISWISVNSSKPGRPQTPGLVVHSSNAWANAHIDDSDDAILAHLLSELAAVTGIVAGTETHRGLQRWRYANAEDRSGPGYAIDPDLRLAACGDWFIRGRIEAAFKSADALVAQLTTQI